MAADSTQSGPSAEPPRQIRFQGGIRTLAIFAGGFALIVALWVPVTEWMANEPGWVQFGGDLVKFAVIGALVWVLLRAEGVSLQQLGLSTRHVTSSTATFGVLWLALNLFAVGLAVAFGADWGIQQIWSLPQAPGIDEVYAPLPTPWAAFVLLNFLVAGVVEEVAFRGYLQSKIIALFGDDSRLDIAIAIGVTTVIFGLLHTPGAIVAGKSLGGVVAAALLPTITAVFFGVIYEVTQNLALVALLHGFGNTWPLVVNWVEWSGPALIAFWICTAGVYVGVIGGYRYWAIGTPLAPTISRIESTVAGGAD